jgi:hypothetical protein
MAHKANLAALAIVILVLGNSSVTENAVAQSASQTLNTQDTDAQLPSLYDFYFHHLEAIDAILVKSQEEGKDTSAWRDPAQTYTGMSDDQWKAFHNIGMVCHAKNLSLEQNISQSLKAIANAYQTGIGDKHPPEIEQLLQERKKNLSDAILHFRALTGEEVYAKMNEFLLNHIQVGSPQAPASEPISKGASSKSATTTSLPSKQVPQ